jgi:hypothetical protein
MATTAPPPTHTHTSILEVQDILGDLWTTIKEPLKMKLTKGECRRLNALARDYETHNFDFNHFRDCDKLCDEVKAIWPQYFPDIPLPALPCTDSTAAPTTSPTLQPTTRVRT